MDINNAFFTNILNSIETILVVVDSSFDIVYVNKPWENFAVSNGCQSGINWIGKNYLSPCCKSAEEVGDEFSTSAVSGFRELQTREIESYSMEYPCHSPTEKRWFLMKAACFECESQQYFVITHENITKRSLLEQENKQLAG